MDNISKKFFKSATIYSLEPILSKLVLFGLVPIYTIYLSISDFGKLDYILTIGSFFAVILDLGLLSSFWKFRSPSSGYDKKIVTFNVALLIISFGVIAIIIAFLFIIFLKKAEPFYLLIGIILLAELLKKIFNLFQTIYRANFKAIMSLVSTTIYTVVFVSLNFLFLSKLNMNYNGVIYSYLFSALLVVILFFKVLTWEAKAVFDFALSKEMIKYGLPIMLGNLAAIVITLSSRFFLKKYCGDDVLGEYSYAYKFGTIAQVFLSEVFFLTWNPIRWEIYEMKNGRDIFARFYNVFIVLFPILALCILAGILILIQFITFNNEYLNGLKILPILIMSFMLHSIYYFNAMGMLFKSKTKVIMYIISFSGIINVLLNIVLIPLVGIYGAAGATFVSYLVMYILGVVYGQKYYPIERNYKKEIFIIFLIVVSVIVSTLIILFIKPLYLSGILIFSIALVFLFLSYIFDKSLFADVFSLFKQLLGKRS